MPESSSRSRSFIETLLETASASPDQTAATFLHRGETIAAQHSYAELVAAAGRVAVRLTAEGLAGRPVLVALPAGPDVLTTLLGCFWAGAMAVPVPHPVNARAAERPLIALRDARPGAVITDEVGWRSIGESCPVPMLSIRDLGEGGPPFPDPGRKGNDIAFLQYSSGSTREPAGIAISHGNLVANLAMMQRALAIDASEIVVSWLPYFHDMGLLSGYLLPLFIGGHGITMAPLDFVQKPMRWLLAMDRFRATGSVAPCFGYELCVRRADAELVPKLDLSRWQRAVCGAEPVRRQALAAFAEAFLPAGFQRKAFVPCYGLAEATLMVTTGRPGDGERIFAGAVDDKVACGTVVEGGCLAVLDADGGAVPPGHTGEVWVAGSHVAQGTWDSERGGVRPFARERRDADGIRFVSTGDLGYFSGDAFVPVDRIKDIIIVHGQKLHAIDVEASLRQHPAAADSPAMAAFAVAGPEGDRLVVLCELARDRLRRAEADATAEQMARHVGASVGMVPDVRLTVAGSLPRTTSGKVRRSACRDLFLAGSFDRKAPVTE